MPNTKSRQYVVGRWTFDTQAAAQGHAKEILNRAPVGEPLGGDDALFVRALFGLHQDCEEKLDGHQGAYFFVQQHPVYPNRNFMVMRTDGTAAHFSYRHALRPMPRRLWFGPAGRNAIDSQTRAYREAYFTQRADADGRAPCELTGELILPAECDVHHAVPAYRHIVEAFLAERGLDPETIEYVGTNGGGAAVLTLADEDLADDFARYHAGRAVLQVVSRTAHRSLRRQDRGHENGQGDHP